jgi:3-oxoacyl-(acyl-carrier-protein) synthase
MTAGPARIAGLGMVSALGADTDSTLHALRTGVCAIKPLTLFLPASHDPLPVGEAHLPGEKTLGLPRSHRLARAAADQGMAGQAAPPDAVVLGTTTGGMDVTETLLMAGISEAPGFARHALATVAEDLARRFGCRGPVLTVSTACSSGAVAVRLALEMIRRGMARRVLAGGVDSLCRLTYYGFKSLQLIDPDGARPFDAARRGMSLSEAAAFLLLDGENDPAAVMVCGGGLSCDAFHPSRPHPQGDGALAAMRAALTDAGLEPEAVNYLNLHGTGTADNDRSEALAVQRLFARRPPPPLSSIKGAMGHSLAAAGAFEAAAAALCVANGLMPANTGLGRPDPQLALRPLSVPVAARVDTVLSNSFGFGGNNAALVIGRGKGPSTPSATRRPLRIGGLAAVTGAGRTRETLDCLYRGVSCKGFLDDGPLCAGLDPARLRRLGRLSRMALALAEEARPRKADARPDGIFWGTAMGALSETWRFLNGLFTSKERFCSPTDFIGSVHNAPAGQIALQFDATGPNVTLSGGVTSFAQALTAADLLTAEDATALVAAADEHHEPLTARIDPALAADPIRHDGGGALWLHRRPVDGDPVIRLLALANAADGSDPLRVLADRWSGDRRYDLILAVAAAGAGGMARMAQCIGHEGPVVDCDPLVGVHGAASAVAVVLAAALVRNRKPFGTETTPCEAVLVVGAGTQPWALEVAAE